MKNTLFFRAVAFLFAASFGVLAQGTVFTYQGRLSQSGNPASGSYDFRFRLASDALGNAYLGNTFLTNGVPVANGVFTVFLDFGANFPGADRWLEIGARTNGSGSYNTLTPLTHLSPTPYAITARNLSGVVPSGSISGTYSSPVTFNHAQNSFTGNGSGLSQVNAATLNGLSGAQLWQTTGNSGTTPGTHFLGTTDNEALDLRVNNVRALRLAPMANNFEYSNIVNVIGGSAVNFVAPAIYGATIGGGGGSPSDPLAQGSSNRVSANFGTVSGGAANISSGFAYATVSGGQNNHSSGYGATVLGGGRNNSSGSYATVGGFFNTSSGDYAFVGSGRDNVASGMASFVGGGGIDGGQIFPNHAAGVGSVIGGGAGNSAPGHVSIIGGGRGNVSSGYTSVVSGGYDNHATNDHATVPGGGYNTAGGRFSLAAGQRAKATHNGAFVWSDSQNADFASTANDQFLIRATGGVGIGTTAPSELLHVAGNILTSGHLSFGSSMHQMLNLWGTQYGIGVQSSTLYFRTDGTQRDHGFAWFKGGVHSDDLQDPGPGGATLMTLDETGLTVNGQVCAQNVSCSSDRNLKENFAPVSPRDVLDKVAALPISHWNFKGDAATAHVGPMAQDFHAAFGLGTDDKHIATVDADGVALAAIQGLNQKLEEKDARISDLEKRLAALEKMIQKNE